MKTERHTVPAGIGAPPIKLAAIDIGANSIHLVVSRLFAPGILEVLDREREMLRLGQSTFRSGSIPPLEMNRAIELLARYRAIAESQGVEAILAVATSAVREAQNRDEFVRRARKEARLTVRVVTGEEEGRLIYLGVRDALPQKLRRVAVIDIGGGSVEIVVGEGVKKSRTRCLKLGVLRLAARFPGDDSKTVQALERHIRPILRPAAREVAAAHVDAVMGTSGSILTVADILDVRDNGRPIRRREVADLVRQLSSCTPRERSRLPGVGNDRADTILAGTIVLKIFMEEAGLKAILPCERALREGVVADYALRNGARYSQGEKEIQDPRRRSVHVLCRRLGVMNLHSRQTAHLATRLFDSLAKLHRLPAIDRELLEYAALLHDGGYLIGAQDHHKHVSYLIRHATLEGFTKEEVEFIALVARHHRGAHPGPGQRRFSRLPKDSRRRIRILSSFLRIADGLDRSHAAVVHDLAAKIQRTRVDLRLRISADADLELHAAQRRSDLFESLFHRTVHFQTRRSALK